MEDDGLYARDDGSLVPLEECTHEELLRAIGQLRQAIRVQKARIELLQNGHANTRTLAYKRAAEVIAALAD